jgi:hypothetical protein
MADSAMAQEDRRITVTDAAKLEVCCGSAYSIIHKGLRWEVGAKAAYKLVQTGTFGSRYAIFAVIS